MQSNIIYQNCQNIFKQDPSISVSASASDPCTPRVGQADRPRAVTPRRPFNLTAAPSPSPPPSGPVRAAAGGPRRGGGGCPRDHLLRGRCAEPTRAPQPHGPSPRAENTWAHGPGSPPASVARTRRLKPHPACHACARVRSQRSAPAAAPRAGNPTLGPASTRLPLLRARSQVSGTATSKKLLPRPKQKPRSAAGGTGGRDPGRPRPISPGRAPPAPPTRRRPPPPSGSARPRRLGSNGARPRPAAPLAPFPPPRPPTRSGDRPHDQRPPSASAAAARGPLPRTPAPEPAPPAPPPPKLARERRASRPRRAGAGTYSAGGCGGLGALSREDGSAATPETRPPALPPQAAAAAGTPPRPSRGEGKAVGARSGSPPGSDAPARPPASPDGARLGRVRGGGGGSSGLRRAGGGGGASPAAPALLPASLLLPIPRLPHSPLRLPPTRGRVTQKPAWAGAGRGRGRRPPGPGLGPFPPPPPRSPGGGPFARQLGGTEGGGAGGRGRRLGPALRPPAEPRGSAVWEKKPVRTREAPGAAFPRARPAAPAAREAAPKPRAPAALRARSPPPEAAAPVPLGLRCWGVPRGGGGGQRGRPARGGRCAAGDRPWPSRRAPASPLSPPRPGPGGGKGEGQSGRRPSWGAAGTSGSPAGRRFRRCHPREPACPFAGPRGRFQARRSARAAAPRGRETESPGARRSLSSVCINFSNQSIENLHKCTSAIAKRKKKGNLF
ncbi:basic proline-rich protein-like [Mustela lutreola]|uniref:basic proline-rich protein-like n=1 Tax=Mustela lutreola TaxID=9666 RepID=UPI002797ABDD|nr:basic proline-rich protein-like [Mustela lutreola]